MALPWIKVAVDLLGHPKIGVLASLLGSDRHRAMGLVIGLWQWFSKYAPDGVAPASMSRVDVTCDIGVTCCDGHTGAVFEGELGWIGNAGTLVTALVEAGFLEMVDGRFVAHDWATHAKSIVDNRAKNAERQRAYRARKASERNQVTGDERSATVTCDNHVTSRVTQKGVTPLEEIRGEEIRVDTKSLAGNKCPPPVQDVVVVKVQEQVQVQESKEPILQKPTHSPVQPQKPQPESGPSKPKKVPDTRHATVIAIWCQLWTELRGGTYSVQGAKDGAAVQRMLKFPDATDVEINRRCRVAFADAWFREHGDLAMFVSKWSTWNPPIPKARTTDPRVGSVRAEDQHHPTLKNPNVAEPLDFSEM